jgi:ferredoxin
MMRVDLEKCTGCGECLEACPVEAISIVSGKAAIDLDTCLSCEACAEACPQGAISEARLPVPVRAAAIQLVKPQTALPVLTSRPESRLAWTGPALTFVEHEIVPYLADTLIAALDRRLLASSKNQVTLDPGTVRPINGVRRQARRRCRGRKS